MWTLQAFLRSSPAHLVALKAINSFHPEEAIDARVKTMNAGQVVKTLPPLPRNMELLETQ